MEKKASTRIDFWSTYRQEIEANITLQKVVKNSHEKLKILQSRLKEVLPQYFQKYDSKVNTWTTNLDNIDKTPYYPLENVEKLIQAIEKLESTYSFKNDSFDDLNFSSKTLDDIIQNLMKGSNKQKLKEKIETTHKITIEEVNQVEIKKPKIPQFNVAIDGPSGVGKSTIARLLAKKWNLIYLNTGLVYRAIAFKMIQEKIDFDDKIAIKNLLGPNMIELKIDEIVLLNKQDITLKVRSDQVSQLASQISTLKFVRDYVNQVLQKYTNGKGIIAEGRDTTFKILPHAEIKIFLDALAEIRAKRRVDQNKKLGYNINYQEILTQIKQRDNRDRNRRIDPLHQSQDAILIDTSYLNLEQVVNKINKIIEKKLKDQKRNG